MQKEKGIYRIDRQISAFRACWAKGRNFSGFILHRIVVCSIGLLPASLSLPLHHPINPNNSVGLVGLTSPIEVIKYSGLQGCIFMGYATSISIDRASPATLIILIPAFLSLIKFLGTISVAGILGGYPSTRLGLLGFFIDGYG